MNELTKEEINFLSGYLKRHLKERNDFLREVVSQEEKQFWNSFFQLSELKKIINKLENNNA